MNFCKVKECQNLMKDRSYTCCVKHFSLSEVQKRDAMIVEVKEHLESKFPDLDFPIQVSCIETTRRKNNSYNNITSIWIVVNGMKFKWFSYGACNEIYSWEIHSKAEEIIEKLIKQKQDDKKQRERERQRDLKAEQEYKEANAKDTIELDKISKYIKSERSHDRPSPRGYVQRTIYTVVKGNITIHLEKEHGGHYGIDRINRPIQITGIEITDLSVGDSVKKILEESK